MRDEGGKEREREGERVREEGKVGREAKVREESGRGGGGMGGEGQN